jgi:hypothetical protein
LNNRWQRKIKDEKERRRNACIIATTDSEFVEHNDTDENQLVGAVEDELLSNFNSNEGPLNFKCIVSVTKIAVPVENTREHIVQQFTLNKNQRAAFMIITGHLDGMNKLNEGKMTKSKNQLFFIYHFCRW